MPRLVSEFAAESPVRIVLIGDGPSKSDDWNCSTFKPLGDTRDLFAQVDADPSVNSIDRYQLPRLLNSEENSIRSDFVRNGITQLSSLAGQPVQETECIFRI